jgi:hypothetical protein
MDEQRDRTRFPPAGRTSTSTDTRRGSKRGGDGSCTRSGAARARLLLQTHNAGRPADSVRAGIRWYARAGDGVGARVNTGVSGRLSA